MPQDGGEGANPFAVAVPNMQIALLRAQLLSPQEDSQEAATAMQEFVDYCIKHDAGPLYVVTFEEADRLIDDELYQKMICNNDKHIVMLKEKLADKEENYGETEVRDVLMEFANYYGTIGDKKKAILAYGEVLPKAVGSGTKLEVHLAMIRLGLFWRDTSILKQSIDAAERVLEVGGDWERRNKIQVYKGLFFIMCRQFEMACKYLASTLATYTATETLSFDRYIFYTCLVALFTRKRSGLKELLDSPEVAQVLSADQVMDTFLRSFYVPDYHKMFPALVQISYRLKCDFFMENHRKYFVRSMRQKAYAQFLEPYQSVNLNRMAEQFRVSEDFLEKDLVSFIAANGLGCKVDKVSKLIHSIRPNFRRDQHERLLNSGDLLLNRIGRLIRAVDL